MISELNAKEEGNGGNWIYIIDQNFFFDYYVAMDQLYYQFVWTLCSAMLK